MSYLYENKELVYEKQMRNLKTRIVFVNTIIFASNFIATLILIFNEMKFINFLHIVFPVFALNLLISYAILINKDSNEQLYLAMYISIIGTIVVMINIFINVQNPATYMLIYLATAIISVFKDRKAVSLGYFIIFIFSTIINFKYRDAIIPVNYPNYPKYLLSYLLEGILIIILTVQTIRTFYNEKEIDDLYNKLEIQKEMELKYHETIYRLLEEKGVLVNYTDTYVNENTKVRLFKYLDLFSHSFFIRDDLQKKLERYFDLQLYKNPQRILGKKFGSYLLKKELNHFETMSTYQLTKFYSFILSTTYKNQTENKVDYIKNYEFMFMNPDMSLEDKIIGFVIFYEHLRNEKPYINNLSHEQIVAYLSSNEAKEMFDKEILKFFLLNEDIFNEIYETSTKNDNDLENLDNNN